jgi:hypothetical protein
MHTASRRSTREAINQPYGILAGIDQAATRELSRNELAYEDHRWYNIRRWKIAMGTTTPSTTVAPPPRPAPAIRLGAQRGTLICG